MTISSGSGLSDVAFLVLASLADGPKHGLRVTEDIEARTGGDVRIGPGALYGALKRLRERGLIEELDEAPDPDDDDSRRRYYRITTDGRTAARKEAGHLKSLVRLAESKQLLLDER